MTIFKTFLKVLNKYKITIIIYSIILIFFAGFNMKSNDNNLNFTASTPNIIIINNDKDSSLTKDLIAFLSENSNIKELKNTEEDIDDALFYRDISYAIYIPDDFGNDFLNNKDHEIKVKSNGDYNASLAEMLLNKYLKIADIYRKRNISEEELIKKINMTLAEKSDVILTTKLDSDTLMRLSSYYNFTNYCFLATSIYIICLILSSFKNPNVNKRTIISSLNYRKFNFKLLLCNILFALVLWLFYTILALIIFGSILFSLNGLLFIINSLIFLIFTVVLAFLLNNLIQNKEAINGIVNIIALGSSFLCGAFVPMEYLPVGVLKIAHILPSYYFIKNNNLIRSIEIFNYYNLKPIIFNGVIIVLFSIGLIIINNIASKLKQKIN